MGYTNPCAMYCLVFSVPKIGSVVQWYMHRLMNGLPLVQNQGSTCSGAFFGHQPSRKTVGKTACSAEWVNRNGNRHRGGGRFGGRTPPPLHYIPPWSMHQGPSAAPTPLQIVEKIIEVEVPRPVVEQVPVEIPVEKIVYKDVCVPCHSFPSASPPPPSSPPLKHQHHRTDEEGLSDTLRPVCDRRCVVQHGPAAVHCMRNKGKSDTQRCEGLPKTSVCWATAVSIGVYWVCVDKCALFDDGFGNQNILLFYIFSKEKRKVYTHEYNPRPLANTLPV